MKITVLSEDTSVCGLPHEHGLSLYIESRGRHILFDSGQSDLFLRNAEKLKIDPAYTDAAVLSHGHYDHGGGLCTLMRLYPQIPVYASRYAFEPHYNTHGRFNGLDPSLPDAGNIIYVQEKTEIMPGMTVYDASYVAGEPAGAAMYTERDGIRQRDDFRHEQYLMIEEEGRKILFSGCSHKGITAIAESFRPDILIGGFHLTDASEEDLRITAEKLQALNAVYYTCHCTGRVQYEYMNTIMTDLHYLSAGESVII